MISYGWVLVVTAWLMLGAFAAGVWRGRCAGDRDQVEEDAWLDAMAADGGDGTASVVVPIAGILPVSSMSAGNVPAVPGNSHLAHLRPGLEHQVPMSPEVRQMRERMAELTQWVDDEVEQIRASLYTGPIPAVPAAAIQLHSHRRARTRRPR